MKLKGQTPIDIFFRNYNVENTPIEDLPKLQREYRSWQTLSLLSAFGTFASMFSGFTPGVLICILALSFTLRKSGKYSNIVKKNVGSNITSQVLRNVFDEVQYDPLSHISGFDLDRADFKFHYDKIEGSDHVLGKYKGLNIEMSDVKLISISHDKDGHTEENTIFEGLWMICDFGKHLVADVQVCERSRLGQLFSKGGIKTENEAFNKQFFIRSSSQEEAFYILTPHMMEYIVQMDAKANARTYLSFLRNGKLHIALHSGKDSFEIKGFSSDVEKIKGQFEAEIRQITDLIDELRLSDSIFEK